MWPREESPLRHNCRWSQHRMHRMLTLAVYVLLGAASAVQEEWQPIASPAALTYSVYSNAPELAQESSSGMKIVNLRPPSASHGSKPSGDACSVYKASMTQELPYQYVEYEKRLPDLKEFTLCMWTKFHNHSSDHPLFSYTVGDNLREISLWISNTDEASFFSMAVHGQTFFRLNYPLKLNTWYHSCQSWNGKTGEWQIWVNAERVGRGFHNRLVGHVIKGGGVAISGQDQARLYDTDGIPEKVAPQAGLIGEVTMLQLYHVALTAGKAHKDHKHHHVHHFKHDGTPIESSKPGAPEPPPPQPVPLGNGNFLVAGQLQRPQNLNLADPKPQMVPAQLSNGHRIQQQYVNGQLGSRVVSEQLININQDVSQAVDNNVYVPQQAKATSVVYSSSLLNPANVQYIDDSLAHNLYKRDSQKRDKRDNPEKETLQEDLIISGKKEKRELVMLSDGSVVDKALLSPVLSSPDDDSAFRQSLLDGLAGVVGNIPVQNMQKSEEREPAEAEVKAVMQVCSGCAPEPFKKVLVLSWRGTPKKLYSGAHYYKGLPICRAF